MNTARSQSPLSTPSERLLTWESYHKFCHPAFFLYGLTAALSIAASQIILVAVILYWSILQCRVGTSFSRTQQAQRDFLSIYFVPVFIWILLAAFACVVGLDPARSFMEFYKTAMYMLLPFAVCSALTTDSISDKESLRRIFLYFRNFVYGSAVASLHTILSTANGAELPIGVPGGLTEAGQLVLFIPIAIYTLFELGISEKRNGNNILLGIVFSLLLLFLAWPQVGTLIYHLATGSAVQLLSAILILAIVARTGFRLYRSEEESRASVRLEANTILTAILFGALLFNLKRGPWFAVVSELCLIGLFFSRRLLYASAGCAVLLFTLVEPIRSRIASLLDHFLIHGGRSSMWQLGAEMSGRFPLGVGLDNAVFMRKLDPTMPETHMHMHNNFINIAVETGFLGLAVFLWWNILMISLGFKLWSYSKQSNNELSKSAGFTAAFIAIALLGWQLSGLVEYNFGDGEIRLVVLFLMGVLLSLTRFFDQSFLKDKSSQQ